MGPSGPRVAAGVVGALLLTVLATGCGGGGGRGGTAVGGHPDGSREQRAKRGPGTSEVSGSGSGGGSAEPGRPRRGGQRVTAPYTCGGTRGAVQLTARAGDRAGEVRFTLVATRFTTPMALEAGEVKATLRLANTARGRDGTEVFRGTNPTLKAGQPVRLGPLTGRVERGDRLDSHRSRGRPAVRISYGPLDLTCRAEAAQRPGPFTF